MGRTETCWLHYSSELCFSAKEDQKLSIVGTRLKRQKDSITLIKITVCMVNKITHLFIYGEIELPEGGQCIDESKGRGSVWRANVSLALIRFEELAS